MMKIFVFNHSTLDDSIHCEGIAEQRFIKTKKLSLPLITIREYHALRVFVPFHRWQFWDTYFLSQPFFKIYY